MIFLSDIAVGLQVLIPRAPEVQKAMLLEQAVAQNNELINLHKDKKIAEEKLNQVNRKEKPGVIRINKESDRERKREEQRQERETKRDLLFADKKKEPEKTSGKNNSIKDLINQKNKIDIRI